MESQARSHTLVRLQIDETKPKKVTLLATVLIFLLGLFFILSVIVPDPLANATQDDEYGWCIKNVNITPNCATSRFDLYTQPVYMKRAVNVSGLNQLLFVDVVLHPHIGNLTSTPEFSVDFQFKLSIYELTTGEQIGETLVKEVVHNTIIHCTSEDDTSQCDETNVALIPELKFGAYLIIIEVLNSEIYRSLIASANFKAAMIATSYSNYLLALRYTFVCVSMISCFVYMWRMRGLRMFRDWIIEQKAIMVLSFLLILFNNPFYALVILVPGETSFFFSTLFTVNFAIFLYAFWLTTYQRIRLENQQRNTKTLTIWKVLFLLILWVFVLASLCLLNHYYLQDPGFDFDSEYQKTFLAFKIIAILLCAVALIWLLKEVIYIIQNFHTRIWRQKLLFVLSSFFIFAFFVFIFSGAFSSFNENGSRVLLSITLMNLYIFVLQLLYVPTEKGIRESQQIERIENERPYEMNYDVLEDNINIEFNSPYNDHQGIQMAELGGEGEGQGQGEGEEHSHQLQQLEQYEGEEDSQQMQHHHIEAVDDDEDDRYPKEL